MTTPFVEACKPKRVGPKTMARFELDMELLAEFWLILQSRFVISTLSKSWRIEVTGANVPRNTLEWNNLGQGAR